MSFKQGVAVAFLQSLFTVLIAAVIFAHTWGKVEQKMIDLGLTQNKHDKRITYLERK